MMSSRMDKSMYPQQFSGDDYYHQFYLAEILRTPEGQWLTFRVEWFGTWQPELNRWYVFSIEAVPGGLALGVDGVVLNTFALNVPSVPLAGVMVRAGWISTNEFDWVRATLFPDQVATDIKPGSYPNTVNMKNEGVIPVAVLSSPDFDAPSIVDRGSLTFGHAGDEQSLRSCAPGGEDVNFDGFPDLVCHFYTQLTGFLIGDTQGVLRGQTLAGTPFEGSDSVRIIV